MREYIRHPVDIPIEFQRDQGNARGQHETLSNISQGGLAFRSHSALEVGAVICIRIPISEPPYEAQARVAWCKPVEGGFEIGVALLGAEEGFRSRMVEQICHIEHYRQEVMHREGRQLSAQQAALEWISKYADTFAPEEAADPQTHAHP